MLLIPFPYGDIIIPVEPFVSIGTPILVAFITGCFGIAYLWLKPKFDRIEAHEKPPEPEPVDGLDPMAWLVREVGGIRADVRAVDRRVDRLTQRFNKHVDH